MMLKTEIMVSACVTVSHPDGDYLDMMEYEIKKHLEEVLQQYGTHVAVDVPDMRDRVRREPNGRLKKL